VERTQALTATRLFRPPYGRMTRAQSHALRGAYDVVMWDVLSADFDARTSNERCLLNVTSHASSGSIIVFHDSLKAEDRLRYALPRTLEHFTREGYRFAALPTNGITAAR
ncbi:MAG TPA: polysaccharide deacetylase family protein, partial [Flavobacteriales bacterium]|nr:polysaccharide deacetylase family protein [Flavobacteriales bacterium]